MASTRDSSVPWNKYSWFTDFPSFFFVICSFCLKTKSHLHQRRGTYHFATGLNCACLFFSRFSLFFSRYLPLKDPPEGGILDPLDLVNGAVGHGAFEQRLDSVILRWFGEPNELEQRKPVKQGMKETQEHEERRCLLRKYLVVTTWMVVLVPVMGQALGSGRAGAGWCRAATKTPTVKTLYQTPSPSMKWDHLFSFIATSSADRKRGLRRIFLLVWYFRFCWYIWVSSPAKWRIYCWFPAQNGTSPSLSAQ